MLSAPTPGPTNTPVITPMSLVPPGATVSASIELKPRLTPDQVR